MPVQVSTRGDSAAGRARVRAELTTSRLARYPAPHGAAVRRLAAQHFALADLSVSFPALLFALATTRDAEAARRGVEAVRDGRSLREAAALAGAPMWLRALPPEAFDRPLPPLPDGPLFARRIANHLPRRERAAFWLKLVSEAARWGDENLAVWFAQQWRSTPRKIEKAGLKLVCLWAWMSARPESKGGALCRQRWSPRLTFARALDEARDWSLSVELTAQMGQGVDDGWLTAGVFGEYEFSPLLTASEVIAQAHAMRNCVRTYGSSLGAGRCRLWSVTREGRPLATVELGALIGGGRFVTLGEARGRNNRDLPFEVERAIHDWVRSQPLLAAPAPVERSPDRAAWLALWRPYWLAKRTVPAWLPLSPDDRALSRLRWEKSPI